MQKTFTKQVKEEIEKHVEKNVNIEFSKISYDRVTVKKDLRVKFLKHGTVYDPINGYHLEYNFNDYNKANSTIKELAIYDISAKLSINNQGRYVVYVVDKNNIMSILKLLGATKSYKEYNDVSEYKKKVKGTQAKVNFETANISKSVQAGLAQLEDIKKLLKRKKLQYLDEGLQQVIKMRQKYPTMPLTELAEKIGNVSKSALNHRFIKIRNMVKEL